MQRKRFLTILIGIVVLAVIGVILFLILSFARNNNQGGQGDGFSLFPGGTGSQIDTGAPSDISQETPSDEPVDNTQDTPRLRRLADFPVVALASHYRPEKIVVDRIVEVPVTIDESTGEESAEAASETTTTETVTEILDINQLYARYVRQEDGAVFTSKIADMLEQNQTTLGAIPYAGDSVIGNNGNSIVYRFFNDTTGSIETFIGNIEEKKIPEAVCAAALPGAITADSDESQIILLQEFLNYTLEKEETVSDGQLGSGTRQDIRDFQDLYNLERTGEADVATISEINNQCLDIVQEKSQLNNPTDLGGVFLTNNIVSMSVSPSSENLVYFTEQENNTVAIVLNFETRDLRQIFSSPFSEWAPYWTSEEGITVHTKPSGLVEGFIYTLDPETGNLNKFADNMLGLTGIINGTQNRLFISRGGTTITSQIMSTITGRRDNVSFGTLPEKCVWSQDSVIIYCAVPDFIEQGLYPDDWYKGKVSFTDSIWSLNTQTGETRRVADLSLEGGEPFDVITPTIEENELYLFFVNKRTGEPWVLEL